MKAKQLRGAALRSAAARKARATGYDVVVRTGRGRALCIHPDGSTQHGSDGAPGFCINFGPDSPAVSRRGLPALQLPAAGYPAAALLRPGDPGARPPQHGPIHHTLPPAGQGDFGRRGG